MAENPFVRYRQRLDAYSRWMRAGGSDVGFVDLVHSLDTAVAMVESRPSGCGFELTPLSEEPELAAAAGLGPSNRLWVKDETNNVSGSHKARHLFGLALHLGVDALAGEAAGGELVIASCGNAALGAAVVAKAADRVLRVFIPVWADEAVVAALVELDAIIERCERRDGEVGDPCYLRFKEAVAAGAVAFSVQGSDVPRTLDGGRTIGWELAEALAHDDGSAGVLDRVFVQVGGGALGACLAAGLRDGVEAGWLAKMPRVHAVQTESAAPLHRAWQLLSDADVSVSTFPATADQDRFMWPWEEVGESSATGILDDVTYDWVPLTKAMMESGGGSIVVEESLIERAHRIAHSITSIDVDPTGTAGLAGLLSEVDHIGSTEQLAVLFTGHTR